MLSAHRLKRGDFVRVRLESGDCEWTKALVGLASDSQPSSVMLVLNSPVRAQGGLLTGGLPLTVDYEHETAVSLFGDPYEIEVMTHDQTTGGSI